MGTDKGLLLFDSEALIVRIIKVLQRSIPEIVIVSNNPEYGQFGREVIPDLIRGIGPAAGIYTALQHTTSEKIFVTGCDMPLITSQAVDYIVSQSTQAAIALPVHLGKIQPLFGVYSRKCLAKWKKLIEAGETRLQDMVVQFNLLKIDAGHPPLSDGRIFTNLNDKNDLIHALNSIENES